jgi:hypothetical protein
MREGMREARTFEKCIVMICIFGFEVGRWVSGRDAGIERVWS